MTNLMNIDVLMNLVCSASLLSKDLSPIPDLCAPNNENIRYHRRVSSVSEHCLIPGCIKEDSKKPNELLVDTTRLAYLLEHTLGTEYCMTPDCIKAASDILENLDEKTNPCKDFYRFACGGWVDRHYTKQPKSDVSILINAQRDIDLKLKRLLEEELTGNEPRFIRLIKEIYNSCMDETSGKRESNIWKNVLKNLGGWPVVEGLNWNSSNFNWIDILIKIRNLGYSPNILLTLFVDIDPENRTLGRPLFGTDDKYMKPKLPQSRSYLDSMKRIAEKMASKNLTENEFIKVFDFERLIYSVYAVDVGGGKRYMNRKYTIKQLMDEINEIDWIRFFNGLLNATVSENDTVLVEDVASIKIVARKYRKTDKRVLANYIIWRVVQQSLPLLSEEWRKMEYDPSKILTENRYEECLASIRDNMGIALSAYYVQNYKSIMKERKDSAEEYANYIHQEYIRIINNVDWTFDRAKERFKAKAGAITSYIGYSEELLNDSFVNEVYQKLSLNSTSYFLNTLSIRKWSTDYSFSLLGKPNVKRDWKKYSKATVTQTFYHAKDNSIEIPAGILNLPVFSSSRPRYLNFGSLGFTIAHALAHALDNKGRQFDMDGSTETWWNEPINSTFGIMRECLILHYDSYTENGMKVNGKNTLEENLSDVIAMKTAYKAYQSWVTEYGCERKLPGLKYTPNQLFWISTANLLCEHMSQDSLQHIFMAGKHSPSKFREIGPMSALRDFSKDFNCPPRTPMRKTDVCPPFPESLFQNFD